MSNTTRGNHPCILAIGGLLSMLIGCGPSKLPTLSDEGTLTEVTLVADELGALQESNCLRTRGLQACALYPNPLACNSMKVAVRLDGSTDSKCTIGNAVRRIEGMLEGVPLGCAQASGNCVRCADLYGRSVFDSCATAGGRQIAAESFTVAGSSTIQSLAVIGQTVVEEIQTLTPPANNDSGQSDDAGHTLSAGTTVSLDLPPPASTTITPTPVQSTTGPPPVTPPTTTNNTTTRSNAAPPPTQSTVCVDKGRDAFVRQLNEILAANGLNFSLQLDAAALAAVPDWKITATVRSFSCDRPRGRTDCDPAAASESNCYCSDSHPMQGSRSRGAMCRCTRMTSKATIRACSARPSNCPAGGNDAYILGIVQAYQAASLWLNPGGSSQSSNGVQSLAQAQSPDDFACLGSPLVVDLAGNGVALSAAEKGVRFDLAGGGARQTAWIRGKDDALLAIDLNGNGQIDSGRELFGEAISLGGTFEPDGFAALSWLDDRRYGGNANGMVDAADRMFGRLLLWRDLNRDGKSSDGELTPLAATRITALSTRGVRAEGHLFDTHGNETGLRGFFLTEDGQTGTLVDVYFTNR